MSKDKKLKTSFEKIREKRAEPVQSDGLLLRMQNLLDRQPALMQKLLDAIDCGRYFIAVTILKKDSPDDRNDLKHFWVRDGLAPNDVTSSLRHILRDYNSKENPNAIIDEPGGGLY